MELTWLFDLDDTLHLASRHIFPHINHSMTRYVETALSLSQEEASALRDRYWKQYGATLLGLVRHHGINPHHFLWHTHQFEALDKMIVREQGLVHTLKRLPGRKLILTNAPQFYAEEVLKHLGIRPLFEAVIGIEALQFCPKPHPKAFRQVMQTYRLSPAKTVLVEDTLSNLKAARRLGFKTVWLTRQRGWPSAVDIKLLRLADLPAQLSRLRT